MQGVLSKQGAAKVTDSQRDQTNWRTGLGLDARSRWPEEYRVIRQWTARQVDSHSHSHSVLVAVTLKGLPSLPLGEKTTCQRIVQRQLGNWPPPVASVNNAAIAITANATTQPQLSPSLCRQQVCESVTLVLLSVPHPPTHPTNRAIMLTQCWAPCFTLNSGYLNLERASRLIALYTGATHVVAAIYAVWILAGGQSDTFFTPFFEFSRRDMYTLAGLLIVYSLAYILLCSLGLFRGVRTVRGRKTGKECKGAHLLNQ